MACSILIGSFFGAGSAFCAWSFSIAVLAVRRADLNFICIRVDDCGVVVVARVNCEGS